jgi:hypothetical protein
MYEHHTENLLPRRQFLYRLARHGGLAGLVLMFSLAAGTVGFHLLAPQQWLDAFLNTSMLLGGMGPVGNIERAEGKIFASLFALYAGIVFLGVSALFLAPVLHRVTHTLHLREKRPRK